jgi:hypothetical protein
MLSLFEVPPFGRPKAGEARQFVIGSVLFLSDNASDE